MSHTVDTEPERPVDEVLRTRAEALAHAPDEVGDTDPLDVLTFARGDERFALDLDHVMEVRPLDRHQWSPVPCSPAFVMGAVNIRGRIYAIIDIIAFLGIPTSRQWGDAPHLIRVKGDGGPAAGVLEFCIMVDGIPEVAIVARESIQEASGAISQDLKEYVRGVTDGVFTILNIQNILQHPGIIVDDGE